jgi:hypothetical protein
MANKNHSISLTNQNIKMKTLSQIKNLTKEKENKLRKRSLVQEFKKIKQEIEDEIK